MKPASWRLRREDNELHVKNSILMRFRGPIESNDGWRQLQVVARRMCERLFTVEKSQRSSSLLSDCNECRYEFNLSVLGLQQTAMHL